MKKKNEYCLSAYILETTCKEMYQLTIFLIYRPFSLLRLPAKKAGKFKNHRIKVDTSFHKLSLVIWKQLYLFLIDCTNLKKLWLYPQTTSCNYRQTNFGYNKYYISNHGGYIHTGAGC